MGIVYSFTLREMIRKRVLILAFGLAVLYVVLYYFGLSNIHTNRTGVIDALVVGQISSMAIYMAGFISAMLAVFSAAGAVAAEIDSGTLHAVLAKPIRRSEWLLGRYAAMATACIAFNTLLLLAILSITALVTGQWVQNLTLALALFCVQPLVLLSVTFFFSILLPTMAAGITGAMLFVVGVIGGMVEQIGAIIPHGGNMVNIGIVSSLLMPADAVYRFIYMAITPSTDSLITKVGLGPFGAASAPSQWMLVYAGLYIVTFFALSVHAFSKKEL